MTKVLAINGSPNTKGNTALMLSWAADALKTEGIETEIYNLGHTQFRGCIACGVCAKTQNLKCAFDDDPLNELLAKMAEADALLLGSPVYFSSVTSNLKAVIDRAGFVALRSGNPFRRKPAAAVVVARRAGCTETFSTINYLFTIAQMIVVGSSYWNLGLGLAPGDVAHDQEAQNTMKVLGENMGWLLKKLK